MVTFLHTADWQIGMTRRWLQPEAQARFDHDRLMAIRAAGRIAREQGCAFVVVAGDVFESNQLRQGTVRRALDAMGEIALPVYLLPGNHDPLDAVSIYRQPTFVGACPSNVTVLDSEGPYDVADGVQIIAAPWRGKHPGRDLVAAALAGVGPADDTIRVLVGHGGVDVLDPSGRSPAAIDTTGLVGAVRRGQIHYVALGDRHSRTDVGGHGCIWYSGTIEVTDPREETPGEVLVVELARDSPPQVVSHRTGTWDFRTLTRDLNSTQDVDRFIAELDAVSGKEKVVLKVALRGGLTLADYARLQEALEGLQTTFAGLREWDRHTDLVIIPDEQQWSQMSISGYVDRAAEEIRLRMSESGVHDDRDRPAGEDRQDLPTGETDSGARASLYDPDRADDADSARDALALLFRLSGAPTR
ncbi:MAG: metallophosphoesterase [Ornithinimicrobium sp.]